jgi:lysozyme
MTQAELREHLEPFGIDRTVHPLVVVGIRGYYRDSMGAPGVNDRGIYDDALFLDTPDSFATFNGNTDPSRVRTGHGTGTAKGMAVLNEGLWYVHKFALHNGKYLALCQRLAQVTVTRDGTPPYQDTGMFGINIHKGGYNTTSSLGCQTVHPDQWPAFIEMAVDHAKRWHGARWNDVVIPYALLED